ncbi:MAG: FG-GAP-like repeat-containing protein [Balneolales bacterium]|nr:FG-GAP-like repeat-containing protein [Balneolales bacterium]
MLSYSQKLSCFRFSLAGILLFAVFFVASCGQQDDVPPGPGSEEYKQAVSDFFVSLAASQTDEARFAFNKMNDVARAYPLEAAAWANLGVFAMRQGNYELAETRLQQARDTAPGNAEIKYLSGMLMSRIGRTSEAVSYFREAASLAPENIRIRFSLITELERDDDVANDEEIRAELQQLLQLAPENKAVLFERARYGAKVQNIEMVSEALSELEANSANWPDEVRRQFSIVKEALADEDFVDLGLELAFFRTAIEPMPVFQDDVRQMQFPPTEIGFFITRFLWLPEPEVVVAEPDMGTSFESRSTEMEQNPVRLARGVTLLEDFPPFPVFVRGNELVIDEDVRLPLPLGSGGNTEQLLPANVFAEIDFNYNFKVDVAAAGAGGFRLFQQNEDQTFTDISRNLGLPSSVLNRAYAGVWPADVDLDGDLDLIVAPVNGEAFALINHADGTFGARNVFSGADNIRDVRWADLDGSGAADALFLDSEGRLHLYMNQRAMEFRRHGGEPLVNGGVVAVAIGDITSNGFFEIAAAMQNGSINMLSYSLRNDSWSTREIVAAGLNPDEIPFSIGNTSLFVAEIDNNGSLDLVRSTPERTDLWLSDEERQFQHLDELALGKVYSVFDIDGSERLDLLGVDANGKAFQLMNSGTKGYNAYSIRARASGGEGDQRINSFGIGGEMEIRSGLMYQKQLITSPIVHFGLGRHDEAEMLRIIWPNGSVQAEFAELGIGATIFNEQILKGSCPWLFTGDGEQFHFITDILWRSPLGLRINAQETAGVIQTLDRVRIPGDKLKPVNGLYDIRVTAELWETHFFDYVELISVDHPENTEVFIDERFVFPAPDLSARVVSSTSPVAAVRDEYGNDLTELVREKDGRYIAPFNRTTFQGVVYPYSIEVELGSDAPADEDIWLVMHGWLRPTDSSLNLALSQGEHIMPSGLKVEIASGDSNWKLLHEDFGIPAGKTKTILLPLDSEIFSQSENRRVRFTTSSEIHWDKIHWAADRSSQQIIKQSLTPVRQELRHRGFSEWYRPDSISPKLANYNEISGTAPRWRDLEGFHTRFGDVSELLEAIDDRYVIMNAGDEMVLEFQALDPVQPGYTRTYIFVSDGWVKDGDYNTEASRTVLPLPYHGQADYEYTGSTVLFDDPVFQRHRKDWVNFHTRYITPEAFRSALILP